MTKKKAADPAQEIALEFKELFNQELSREGLDWDHELVELVYRIDPERELSSFEVKEACARVLRAYVNARLDDAIDWLERSDKHRGYY